MVPKGWERKPIKKVCETIIDCVNKTAPVVDYQTPYKMIRTTNVRNGRVNTSEVRYATEETYKQWIRRGAPRKGDLIFTREAPVGEVGVLENDKGVFLGQRTMMYRVNVDKADNYFLFYSLQSRFCQKQIEDFSNGGTVAHMRVPDCGEIIINAPPLPEQKKIAKILSTWDMAIITTEKLLANSEQQKKALMQQLLTGKKRFQGFAEAWVSYSLNEIFEFKKGKGLSKDLLTATGKKKCILYGELYTKYSEIIKNVFSRTNSSDGFLSKAGDILIPCSTTTNGIDLANAVALLEDDVLLGGDINVLRPKIPIDSSLMAYLLTHIKKHAIASMAQGITIIHLYGSDLKGLQVFIPYVLKEQQKITSALSIADSEIEALRKKIEFVKQEKKALMQQLLTGKRRVYAYE